MSIPDRWTELLPHAFGAVGGLLVAVTGGEFLIRLLFSGSIPPVFYAGVAMSLPFNMLLFAAAYRLHRTEWSTTGYRLIGGWTLAGTLFFTISIGAITPFLFSGWERWVGAIRWGASIGAGGGLIAGYLNARVVRQRVIAERTTVRAEAAERRQELIAYLNAILRHEVLNAMNVIAGQTTILQREFEGNADAADRLASIQRRADDVTEVIEEIQPLLDASEETTTLTETDPIPVIRDELDKLNDREESICIEERLPETALIKADRLLPQLFGNLFRNAVQHTTTEPVKLQVTGRIEDDDFRVRISDNGPGIPCYLQDGLFDPRINHQDGDTRLGTVIVGRLINRYDGEISIVDTGSDGTTIEVVLPIANG